MGDAQCVSFNVIGTSNYPLAETSGYPLYKNGAQRDHFELIGEGAALYKPDSMFVEVQN